MARYKKGDVRIWSDDKFSQLSKPKASAQFLWFRLLFPREASNLPGLFVARARGLCEELEWSLASFRRAWDEIQNQKMAYADWKTGLVFVFNGIKYHEPENPNVVRSWRIPWDELPECETKHLAYRVLRGYIQAKFSPKFLEAFDEVITKPLTKGFPEGFPEGLPQTLRECFGETVAVAVAGTVSGTVTEALPVPIHSQNLKPSSVPEQKNANGSKPNSENQNGKAKPDLPALWGPVEGYIRKQVVPEVFDELYAGIRIVALTSNFVELAVPGALIERNGGNARETAESLTAKILESQTGLLRGRMLKVISFEKFIEKELGA